VNVTLLPFSTVWLWGWLVILGEQFDGVTQQQPFKPARPAANASVTILFDVCVVIFILPILFVPQAPNFHSTSRQPGPSGRETYVSFFSLEAGLVKRKSDAKKFFRWGGASLDSHANGAKF
jgi:hypothetical protein